MKISEFRKILKAIDECEYSIKSINVHGFHITESIGSNVVTKNRVSQELKTCVQGAVIQRKHNLIERLKMAGVSIDELV